MVTLSSALSPQPHISGRRSRYAFIDQYRGLACVLMFEAHAYDRWTMPADRAGFWWSLTRHLAGFPSRLFLLLAGVALVLRLEGQRKKGIEDGVAARANTLRGVEIIGLALAFRLSCWFLGGAHPQLWHNLLRVDILNCIGVSLTLCALFLRPRHAQARGVFGGLILVATLMVWVTPLVERWGAASGLSGNALFWYLTGRRPNSFFPLFPWFGYVLAGCSLGIYLVRAMAHDRLRHAVFRASLLGAMLIVAGLTLSPFVERIPVFLTQDPGMSAPTSFLYRTGMCLVFAGVFYLMSEQVGWRSSMLGLFGQTSLFVYWVHVELVYGHASTPVHRKLSFAEGSWLLLALTLLMWALAAAKTHYAAKWRAKKSQVTATA